MSDDTTTQLAQQRAKYLARVEELGASPWGHYVSVEATVTYEHRDPTTGELVTDTTATSTTHTNTEERA